jgi:two-component sensor histidine kinase
MMAADSLGTSIVKALAQQLDARVEVLSGSQGTTVSITHATFAKMPKAAWKAADLRRPSIRGHA